MSPHPDDDVISCGNTLLSLINRRKAKNITVANHTSGCNAVSTDELKDHLRFTLMSAKGLNLSEEDSTIQDIVKSIKNGSFQNTERIKQLKSKARKSEAVKALESLGLDESDAVFLESTDSPKKCWSLNYQGI